MTKSGYKCKITFQKQQNTSTVTNNTKKRKRKIIWFNSSFSLIVSTNIGENLFSLLGKHFPKTHQFHELFNRNNLKVSYSFLSNFIMTVYHLFKNRLNEQGKPSPCNCRDKTSCLLKGSYQNKHLLHSCKFSIPDLVQNRPHYIGLIEHTGKDRPYKHNNSFKCESKKIINGFITYFLILIFIMTVF